MSSLKNKLLILGGIGLVGVLGYAMLNPKKAPASASPPTTFLVIKPFNAPAMQNIPTVESSKDAVQKRITETSLMRQIPKTNSENLMLQQKQTENVGKVNVVSGQDLEEATKDLAGNIGLLALSVNSPFVEAAKFLPKGEKIISEAGAFAARKGVSLIPLIGLGAGITADVVYEKRTLPLATTANVAGDIAGALTLPFFEGVPAQLAVQEGTYQVANIFGLK